MLNGRFVPLAEDWNCDECSAEIRATMHAFIFERGDSKGRCLCIKCITDPDVDGGGEYLAAWKACRGYSPVYERPEQMAVALVDGGLKHKDHTGDGGDWSPYKR